MKVSWSDLQHVEQPGLHRLANGRSIKVDAKHIVQWKEDPKGTFGTFWYPGDRGRAAQYTLTDFHPSSQRAGTELSLPT
jgi:hypothetical protein